MLFRSPVEGELIVQMGDSGTSWSTQISLPNQSRKQLSIPVYSDGIARPVSVRLVDESGQEVVEFFSGSSLREINSSEALLHVVVSPEPDSHEFLNRISGGRSDAAVAYLSIEEVPANINTLQAVDTLIFSDIDTNGLSVEQRQSIERWVQQGGQLVDRKSVV